MRTDVIVIEVRPPRNKQERNVYGMAWPAKEHTKIFINKTRNKDRIEFLDTLMHELYHAVVGIYGFSSRKEEKIAQEVAKATKKAIASEKRGGGKT